MPSSGNPAGHWPEKASWVLLGIQQLPSRVVGSRMVVVHLLVLWNGSFCTKLFKMGEKSAHVGPSHTSPFPALSEKPSGSYGPLVSPARVWSRRWWPLAHWSHRSEGMERNGKELSFSALVSTEAPHGDCDLSRCKTSDHFIWIALW